jgi:hypothetical protein
VRGALHTQNGRAFFSVRKKKERKEKEKMLIVSEPSRREIQFLKNTERMEDVKDSEKVPAYLQIA